mgnify:CR=1
MTVTDDHKLMMASSYVIRGASVPSVPQIRTQIKATVGDNKKSDCVYGSAIEYDVWC